MIDLKALREDPDRFARGAAAKGIEVDIEGLLDLDARRREAMARGESARADQKRLGKESGPRIGALKKAIRTAPDADRAGLEAELAELEAAPGALKKQVRSAEAAIAELDGPVQELLLLIPQPPDEDVPAGTSADDNMEISRWAPEGFDPDVPFAGQRGFEPRSHQQLAADFGLVDFERGVKIAGARHYSLTGDGMRLHQAVLQWAFETITRTHGFTPTSVPVIVREECMLGTGFFPEGREQAYHVEESSRGAGHDLFLTGTGEVGLMGLHADEILDESDLPLQLATISTCFRREAGAAGRDTAGLYRIHQFDKVEQVVICRDDPDEERAHHRRMINIVEDLLKALELPHRLLQCCTADLGAKNADMIDVECWMPSRGALDDQGRASGDWGETHSASRLHDFQCRRLNLRYRDADRKTHFCWSLNNTVIASPRILIPLLEMHQQADGTVAIPAPLQAYMGGRTRIE